MKQTDDYSPDASEIEKRIFRASIPTRRVSAIRLQYYVVGIFVLALLGSLLYLARVMSKPHELAMRAVCGSNLRGIGQALSMFQNDNDDALPFHYFQRAPYDPERPNFHGVTWIGTMASHADLKISQKTSPDFSPSKGHPSRTLFALIEAGNATTGQFICPSVGGSRNDPGEDELVNFGPDADNGMECTAFPGRNRFDFHGYKALSFGVRLPYGPGPAPSKKPAALPANTVMGADKGPFFEAGGEGLSGTRTIQDRATKVRFPTDWQRLSATQLRELPNASWSKFNSRNHNGDGQNVLYMDSHVEFQRRPIVGAGGDNIYTFTRRPEDAAARMLGEIPSDAPLEGPSSNSDSYIVP